METEVLDFRVQQYRQVANFNIRSHTITLHLAGHFFGLVGQLASAGILILALLFPLPAQYPAGNKERHDTDDERHHGGENKTGPQLLTAPDGVFIGQDLF